MTTEIKATSSDEELAAKIKAASTQAHQLLAEQYGERPDFEMLKSQLDSLIGKMERNIGAVKSGLPPNVTDATDTEIFSYSLAKGKVDAWHRPITTKLLGGNDGQPLTENPVAVEKERAQKEIMDIVARPIAQALGLSFSRINGNGHSSQHFRS